MNVSMQLTVEGLLRALRWRAHSAGEEIAAIRAERRRPAERREREAGTSEEALDEQPRR
jgi:hypothetical protein